MLHGPRLILAKFSFLCFSFMFVHVQHSVCLSHVVLVSDLMLFTSHVFLVLALSLGLRNVTCGSRAWQRIVGFFHVIVEGKIKLASGSSFLSRQ